MNPYRAMCAELAEEVEHLWSIVRDDNNESHSLADRARALLATEPEVPTDLELDAVWDEEAEYYALWPEAERFARAVLAKWGYQ